MPNIKSKIKRVSISREENARNKAGKSALKTELKKFDAVVAAGNREDADKAFQAAVKSVDQAASKGFIHKNKAANKKSAMAKKLATLG